MRLLVPIGACMSVHTANTRCQTVNSYEGPLQSDTQTVAWRLGYKLSHCNTSTFLYNVNAIQGALIWLQKGDNSKPTLVVPHAMFGTPIGQQIQKHMPHDMPIIAIQAPELLGVSIANIS